MTAWLPLFLKHHSLLYKRNVAQGENYIMYRKYFQLGKNHLRNGTCIENLTNLPAMYLKHWTWVLDTNALHAPRGTAGSYSTSGTTSRDSWIPPQGCKAQDPPLNPVLPPQGCKAHEHQDTEGFTASPPASCMLCGLSCRSRTTPKYQRSGSCLGMMEKLQLDTFPRFKNN